MLSRTSKRSAGTQLAGLLALLAAAGCAGPASTSAPNTPAPNSPAPSSMAADANRSSVVRAAPALPAYPAQPWAFEDKAGKLFSTPHYRLYTTTDQPMLLDRLPAFMEAAMANYRTALGELPAPPAQLDSYLLANRPQWARLTQRLMGNKAEPFLRIQRGGFATRGTAVLYDVGVRDTFSLASHEGWHQYSQRTFQNPLPVWLEEGIATYMEGFRWDNSAGGAAFQPWNNLERFEQLRSTHAAGALMPIRELLSTSPQALLGAGRLKQSGADAALTYYAQVWSLVHFLHEGAGGKYRDRFASLLADAASGKIEQRLLSAGGGDLARSYMLPRRGPEFLKLALGADLSEIQSEYEAFVNKLVEPGAKQKIVAGKSPVE